MAKLPFDGGLMRDYEINGSGVQDQVAAAAIQEADRQPEDSQGI